MDRDTDVSWLLSHRRWWATAAPARRLALAELAHTRAYVDGTLTPADEDALIAHAAAARAALDAPARAEALERSARYRAVMREGGPGVAQRVLALLDELTRPLVLDGWEAKRVKGDAEPYAWDFRGGEAEVHNAHGRYPFEAGRPGVCGTSGCCDTLAEAIVAAEEWLATVQESAPSTDREQSTEVDDAR